MVGEASLAALIVSSTALGTAIEKGIHCSACDERRRDGAMYDDCTAHEHNGGARQYPGRRSMLDDGRARTVVDERLRAAFRSEHSTRATLGSSQMLSSQRMPRRRFARQRRRLRFMDGV